MVIWQSIRVITLLYDISNLTTIISYLPPHITIVRISFSLLLQPLLWIIVSKHQRRLVLSGLPYLQTPLTLKLELVGTLLTGILSLWPGSVFISPIFFVN